MNLYEMAEQCNCWLEDTGNLVTDNIDLKAFADLVRADEREACAKVCVALAERNTWWDINEVDAALECAAEIREREETK